MIPRILHTAWFGPDDPRGFPLFARCMATWPTTWPRIVTDESAVMRDTILDCEYMRAVLTRREWVKATELARLFALWSFGGVYVDADVEIVNMNGLERLLVHDFFIGREDDSLINGAIIGAQRKSSIVRALIETFPRDSLGTEKATMYGPVHITKVLNSRPDLNPTILPPEFFYPIHWNGTGEPTEKTVAIHRWAGSWNAYK